eukprot:NODE_999_length_1627_cov_5.370089_g825_i0.p1 GENE.NODE_999_length_1627_cov_5.370089_g825_i0~~NODE_999_length_1627_cov_5.370089_g825_i0.p1  ORF type:complete len:370 (+),score=85.66 NODE_999_length_1627_cov_5.370089_g825_i0:426-1535(+)
MLIIQEGQGRLTEGAAEAAIARTTEELSNALERQDCLVIQKVQKEVENNRLGWQLDALQDGCSIIREQMETFDQQREASVNERLLEVLKQTRLTKHIVDSTTQAKSFAQEQEAACREVAQTQKGAFAKQHKDFVGMFESSLEEFNRCEQMSRLSVMQMATLSEATACLQDFFRHEVYARGEIQDAKTIESSSIVLRAEKQAEAHKEQLSRLHQQQELAREKLQVAELMEWSTLESRRSSEMNMIQAREFRALTAQKLQESRAPSRSGWSVSSVGGEPEEHYSLPPSKLQRTTPMPPQPKAHKMPVVTPVGKPDFGGELNVFQITPVGNKKEPKKAATKKGAAKGKKADVIEPPQAPAPQAPALALFDEW